MRQLSVMKLSYDSLTTTTMSSFAVESIGSMTKSTVQQQDTLPTIQERTEQVSPLIVPPTGTATPTADPTKAPVFTTTPTNDKGDATISDSSAPVTQETSDFIQADQSGLLLEKYQYHPPESRTLTDVVRNATTTCGTFDNNFEQFWSLNGTQRSRADEDKTIYNTFFRYAQNYTTSQDFHYVELGAFNGMDESNTRFYDVCLGWTGLLIEPNPKVYPVLVQNRPYAHRMSYAASCNETNDRDGDNNQTVKFYASIFTNAAEDNSPNGEAYNNSGLEVDVPCGGLHPVLNHVFPSKRIHFFSLDTEGVEYSILQTINFNDIYIDIFIIESWNVFCKEICPHRENVRAFMQSKGYVLYPNKVTFSDLYVHAQSEYASRMSEFQTSTLIQADQSDRLEKYQYHPPESRPLIDMVQNATMTCGTFDNNFEQFWSLNGTQRSRADEDKTIYNTFFRYAQNYTTSQDFHYVELGAFNGMDESNTRFYDVCLGWTGLLIEPNPKVYPVLVQNRPYAHRMSYAASCNETNDRDGDNNQTVKFYASIFTNAAEDNSPNGEAYNNSGLEVDVPCGGLHPVLNHVFPSKRIHFFSLDTEGVEYSILQTINFNDIYIDIFIIESWNVFCKEICPHRENVRAFMQSKGYALYPNKVTLSDLYVHAQSEYASRMSE